MHLLTLCLALSLACATRWGWCPAGSYRDRLGWGLGAFLFPPLLLVTSAVSVTCMGWQGSMIWWENGWISYAIALGFLLFCLGSLLYSGFQAWRTLRQVRTCPQTTLAGQPVRLLDVPLPFSAQIGFWQPELTVSRGLLDLLEGDRLCAVLLHETAHAHYRDTFWFFWLGWLRRATGWLPHSEALWQELVLLREIRADRWAAQTVDPLLVAESLLAVASVPMTLNEQFGAAFSCTAPKNRLQERVDALLEDPTAPLPLAWRGAIAWLGAACLPLLAIPFHT